MQRKKNDDLREERALAAACFSSQGLLQQDIARELGISQPEVSRLLTHARNSGWIRQQPSIVRQAIPEPLWHRVQNDFFSHPDLADHVQSWAPDRVQCKVSVVHAGEGQSFGFAAAAHLATIVAEADVLGIMWGRSIAAAVDGLARAFAKPPRKDDRVRVIPLCGEPLFVSDRKAVQHSSSSLAVRLDGLLNGPGRDLVHSLLGVPAYIPTELAEHETAAVRKFINLIPGYKEIFGAPGSKGMIDDVDTVITGVGVLEPEADDQYPGVFLQERIGRESISERELADMVYGDIAGVMIERPDLSPTQRDLVDKMNAGWTGFRLEHLERQVERSSTGGGRGVVVLAAGAGKAELLRAAVRAGLVNELVVGAELAKALEELE
jgi:DNA-binding transcriptional regulator LsrR (DeoR family)